MSDIAKLGIGSIITIPQNRDAIHVAIAPVVAGEKLYPATRVYIDQNDGCMYRATARNLAIGFVDPCLPQGFVVEKGQTAWLWVYPGTISGLRHHWDHAAFPVRATITVEEAEEREAARECTEMGCNAQSSGAIRKDEAKKWLQDFAQRWDCEYDDMVESATAGWGINTGPAMHEWDNLSEADKAWFWTHMETVTGRVFGQSHRDGVYFSCSC